MYTQFRKLALASTIALIFATAGATSAFAADSTRQEIVNARQESQIWTTYALSPYLRAHDISVTVDNGKATLTGKVEEDVNKDLAKQIALGVDGIKEVDNQINDIEFTTIQRELAELAALTAAQKRVADGSYGACIDCDEPIDDGRLKVQPAALRCLDCQELLERRNFVPG